ncbi:MAG: trehalase family glycosidase [Faecalimonas sp.]|nr:trehalase family glycosidase [Faecalimonas sp.]
MKTIQEYIDENLPRCLRENTEDAGTLIGLPYSYMVPSASGMFQEMYYWDTYFTNKGLLLRGEVKQAQNHVDNLCYMIERFGFVLNGNRDNYLYNSQPPFLSMMARDVYEENKDREWLDGVYEALKKEHHFWMTQRDSEIGLNRYDCMPLPKEWQKPFADALQNRIGFPLGTSEEETARGLISSGESGWDINPRMGCRTFEYAPADLNSLLFAMEENLAFFAEELGLADEASIWKARSEKRAALCREYLKNEDGLFMDYHLPEKKQTAIFSAAAFYPLYFGMATQEEAEAARKALPRLETEYGILTCEKNDTPGTFQWDYPNGWAPMQQMVVGGLLRYGYQEDARRVAKKFMDTVERCYEQTGHLWEKYNIVEGNIEAVNEYEMPAMMGWTFGVYWCFKNFLEAK